MEDEHDYQEEVEIPSETVASNSRKRKQMDTRSDVWTYYNKIKDVNGNLIKGQCKYCSKGLGANTSRNGTGSLRNHLKTCKSYNVEGRQTKLAFQPNKDSGNSSLTSWNFNKDLASQLHWHSRSVWCVAHILNLIVKDGWNSTYEMLDVAEKYEKAFSSIREDECGRKFHSGINHRNQSTTNPGTRVVSGHCPVDNTSSE
ncbi:hypothetical protein POM88_047809 [Heracleum sosnowskyi]|uniref:BED-type domain-containing protein n=1 Tax=Heracleum sosnowskyi TaxID=360622 RepID=A0AAD8GV22_9APIA|nr:hypothetical protein POM88_047809 [Heracleum sosnowskyi]